MKNKEKRDWKKWADMQGPVDSIRRSNICATGVTEGEARKKKKSSAKNIWGKKKRIGKKFTNLEKDEFIDLGRKANPLQNWIKHTPRCIKLLKIKIGKNIEKTQRFCYRLIPHQGKYYS